MKIGINGRFLVAKRTGVQRAAYNLIRTLTEIDQENEYYIFTGESQVDMPEWQKPNIKVIPSKLRESETFLNHMWEQFTLPRLARRYKVDILHSPANMAPLFYPGPAVVNIHDLCFVVNPQWYSFSFRTLYNLVIPRLARRADKVITNSNNSRNDLLQFCHVPAEKVSLVYWAVDEIFNQEPRVDIAFSESVDHDFILNVGSLEPRKNISLLVEAYEHMRHHNPHIKTKLVLIGGESPLFADVRLKIKDFREDVIFKGFVDDEQLRAYYRKASLFVYPSLYEGFGLPPLEAMASGTPVVTSMTSSLPEVVGDSALMVSPYDTEQLSKAMSDVLQDENLSSTLVRRGYEQVKRFNWYRVARATLGIYYEVCHQRSKVKESNHLPYGVWDRLKRLEQSKIRDYEARFNM